MTQHELTILNTSSSKVLNVHMVSPNNLPLLSTLRAFFRITPHQFHKLLLCQAHTLLLRELDFNRGSAGKTHEKLKHLGELGGCRWQASAQWMWVDAARTLRSPWIDAGAERGESKMHSRASRLRRCLFKREAGVQGLGYPIVRFLLHKDRAHQQNY